MTAIDLPSTRKFGVVFGEAVVTLPASCPVEIRADAVFGQVLLPDGRSVSGGSAVYRSEGAGPGAAVLTIKVDCVFGKAVFSAK